MSPILPRDFTGQENLVAEALSELGVGYVQQLEFGTYTVDFFLPDNGLVIEADGFWGHLRKADRIRDAALLETNIEIKDILHIKSTTKSGILQEIQEHFGWNREDSKN